MRPVYFYEGLSAIGAEKVRAIGLGYLLDGKRGVESVGMTRSPVGGKGGAAFAPAGKAGALSEALSRALTWERHPLAEGVHIGHDPKDPPTPKELERKAMMDGHPVTLGDGQEWLIPVARYIDGATPLPRRLKLGDEGWVYGDVQAAYLELWSGGCKLWEQLAGALLAREGSEDVDFTIDDSANLGALALSTNYRIHAGEVSALGLFTTQSQQEVALAIVDWPGLKKVQEAASPNCEGPTRERGPSADLATTAQR